MHTYLICVTSGERSIIYSNAKEDMTINRRTEMQRRKPQLNFRSSFLRVKSVGLNTPAREVIEAALLEMFKLDWAELQGNIFLAVSPPWQWVGCTGWSSPSGSQWESFSSLWISPLLTKDVASVSVISVMFKCLCRFLGFLDWRRGREVGPHLPSFFNYLRLLPVNATLDSIFFFIRD